MIDKNNKTLHAYQYRTIEVYSVNTFNGIATYFSVNSLKTRQREAEFKLAELMSLHKKFWTEGKTTFKFRTAKQDTKRPSSTSRLADGSSKNDSHDYYTVFLSEADPKNLDLFLQNLVNFIQHKSDYIEAIKPSNYIEVETADTGREEARKGKCIAKGKISDIGEYMAKLNQQKICTQSNRADEPYRRASDELKQPNKLHCLFTAIKTYCTAREQLSMTLVSKSLKAKLDTTVACLTVRNHDYPVYQLCKLFARYKQLTKFKVARHVKISMPPGALKDVTLRPVRHFDIAKVKKLTQGTLMTFLKAMPNLSGLKVPLNLVDDEVFQFILRAYGQSLTSLKLKLNISMPSESCIFDNPRALVKLFDNAKGLRSLQLFSVKAEAFQYLLKAGKEPWSLEAIKISTLVARTDDDLLNFSEFIRQCPKLQKLAIDHVRFTERRLSHSTTLVSCFTSILEHCSGIETLLLGHCFTDELLDRICALAVKGKLKLKALKVSGSSLSEDKVVSLVSACSYLQKLNLSKWIELSSTELVDACVALPKLSVVIIRNDYGLYQLFVKQARNNRSKSMKVVRKLRSVPK